MRLRMCPDCGHEMSRRAGVVCPQCGYKKTRSLTVVLVLLLGASIVFYLLASAALRY